MRTFTTVCCHWYTSWRREFACSVSMFLTLLILSSLFSTRSFAQDQRAASIEQWRTSAMTWTGGNINGQNSDYMEGQSVPYRTVLTNLVPGQSTKIIISYQITKGNDVRHAIDYITSYNRTVNLSDATVLNGTGLTAGATKSTYELTAAGQPSLAHSVNVYVPYEGADGAVANMQPYTSADILPDNQKTITIWGGTGAQVTDARYYYENGYTGEGNINAADEDAYIIITLNPGNSTTAVLAWGGHIASRTEWGFLPTGVPRSATGISGSPYHMRLEFWESPYKQIGQQDASMQLDFIPPPCNIKGTEAGTTTLVTTGQSFNCSAPDITVTNLNPGFSQAWTVTGPAVIVGTNGAKTLTSAAPSITLDHTGGCGTITVSVVINYGLEEDTRTCTFTYSVVDNEVPKASIAATKTLGCNPENPASQFGTPTATDNCGTPTLVSGYPQTGSVQENGCLRSLTRTWKYQDACGNVAETSQTLTWTADKTGPAITVAESKTLACNTTNASAQFDVPQVTEGCSTATAVEGYPQTGDVVANECGRSLTRTWKYKDECGNISTATQTLYWTMDTEKPAFKTSSNTKITGADLGCNPSNIDANFAALTAADFTDNCGLKAVAVVSTVNNAPVGCTNSRTRTWRATDNCDNYIEVSQTLTWTVDTQNPWLKTASSSKIAAKDLGCNPTDINGQFAALTIADFEDNCGLKVLNLVSTTDNATVGCTYSRTRTWEIVDNCNNKTTVSQKLSWTVDTQKPTATVAATKALGCNPSAIVFDEPSTGDGCSAVTLVSGYPVTDPEVVTGCNRSQTRTWRYKDACNNMSDIISQTVTWTVDKTGPVVTVAANKALGCNPSNPSSRFDAPVVSDVCSTPALATDYPKTGSVQQSGCNRTQTRTWRYVDACGNATEASQTISWTVDTEAPVYSLNNVAVAAGPATEGYQRVQKMTVEVACDADYSVNPAFTPADNCGLASSSTAPTETVEAANCVTGFKQIVTRKWVATDNCGNKTLLIYEIKVKCCEVMCTYTQGYFGNEGGKACNGTTKGSTLATITEALSTSSTWSGTKDGFLRIGRPGNSIKIYSSNAGDVIEYLPGGGNSYTFTHNSDMTISDGGFKAYMKSTGKGAKAKYNINNTLLAQTITLGINLGIKENLKDLGLSYKMVGGVPNKLITADITGCGSKQVQNCYYNEMGVLVTPYHAYDVDGAIVNYLLSVKLNSDNTFSPDNSTNKVATIEELFHLASNSLSNGAPAGLSLTSIAGMVDMINNAFDECRMFVGYRTAIPTEECTFADGAVTSGNRITENAEIGELPSKLQVQASPNPFNDNVRFTIESPVSGQGSLEVYNLVGQRLETVYQGYLTAGKGQTIEYKVPAANRTTLIYVLKVGGQQVTGKLLNRK